MPSIALHMPRCGADGVIVATRDDGVRVEFRGAAYSDWGYTRFCRGERWSNGMHRRDDDKNYFLAIAPNPNLQFNLRPTGKSYRLSIQTLGIDPYAAKNLTLSVNGAPIKWSVERDFFIEADVPPSALKNGLNKIELQQVIAPGAISGLPITKISLIELGAP